MRRRIGITGVGVVSPFGVGIDALWAGLVEGRSAIGPIRAFDASGFPCRLAGEVQGYSARDLLPKHYRKATKVMARDTELAVGIAKLAVEDAGLVTRASLGEDGQGTTSYPGDRVGCQIGAGLIAAETEELTSALATAVADGTFSLKVWGESGLSNLQPLWLLKYLPNMLACHVTIIHGAEGPSNTITCGEASGLLSLGESARVIERGAADVCFSGGAESKVNLMGLLRQTFAGRAGETGSAVVGTDVVRPYAPGSIGVIGEGGGILMAEALDSARSRGARVYAEVAGFGAGCSSWPPYVPEGERAAGVEMSGDGLELAIRRALKDANLEPGAIDAIVPQASGTELEDRAELGALRAVFGDRLGSIPAVTLTPNIGNACAGAGAMAAAVGAKVVAEQRLPACLNGPGAAWAGSSGGGPASIGAVLVCSGSLGGQNAAAVLARPKA